MTVNVVEGDLFADPAQVWVNAVNCVGVMGAGVAKHFKSRFPAYYLDYYTKCLDGQIELGRVDYYAIGPLAAAAPPPLFVVSFPTMLNPGEVARSADLREGLKSLREFAEYYWMTHLALPALGCGIGKFEFDELKPYVEAEFDDPVFNVNLYKPFDMRKHLDNQNA